MQKLKQRSMFVLHKIKHTRLSTLGSVTVLFAVSAVAVNGEKRKGAFLANS
jgi:hypothetical protein